jgi:hypothetical protein
MAIGELFISAQGYSAEYKSDKLIAREGGYLPLP